MARSASLEIHHINVSQGDSTLIINRDLKAVRAALVAAKPKLTIPPNPIDYVPLAVAKNVSLADTVKKAHRGGQP